MEWYDFVAARYRICSLGQFPTHHTAIFETHIENTFADASLSPFAKFIVCPSRSTEHPPIAHHRLGPRIDFLVVLTGFRETLLFEQQSFIDRFG